ncbi:hypothetical protein [Alienimonas sp. DA493]|uniref:hypothetical protein n=1 Tax=Alienimonas sp. DA493 TaxID=3373605 RepID=UPI003754FF0E
MDDDAPPTDLSAEPAAPGRPAGYFGPSNAAGLGGWCGLAGPWLAVSLGWLVSGTRPGVEGDLLGALGGVACGAAALVIPGYFCGWVGGAIGRWLHRRRLAEWPLARSEFAGGFAAGTALAAGVAWLFAVVRS